MAPESKSNDAEIKSSSVKDVRAKEEIDGSTSLDDVRAPNVFKRAKEEFQALSQVFHHKKEGLTHDTSDGNRMAGSKHEEIPGSSSGTRAKSANLLSRAKEEIKAIMHRDESRHHHHHKETHGRSDDIDENTPTNEVKGPNVFERVKEEFEAVFQAIHPKKES